MEKGALITMLIVQLTVIFFTAKFFVAVLRKPDKKGDSYVDDEQ